MKAVCISLFALFLVMKPILKVAGILIKDCEQTCIFLRCKYFK